MKFFLQALPAIFAAASVGAVVLPGSSAEKRNLWSRQAQDDPQTSFTLDPRVIGPNLASNGLNGGAEAGQVASLTSTNNFINFCLTTGLPNTNGQQVIDGSCNSVPMGVIVAKRNMPSSKFQFPTNGAVIPANQQFTIQMRVSNMDTGNFVNPQTNYFGAPQQVNGAGIVIAHSHVVVELIPSLDSTEPTNPLNFAFFKGLNGAAQGGVLSATVTGGLPAGVYRLSSINTAANHQPILGAVAQHGSFDDAIYFTVGDEGDDTGAGASGSSSSAAATTSAASTPASTPASTAAPSSSSKPASVSQTTAKASTTSKAASTTAKTTSKAASTTAKTTSKVSSTSAAATSRPTSGGSQGNLQRFREALGNISAPVVTPNGRFFAVAGNNQRFNSLNEALRRSCDVQNNQCSDASNRTRRPAFTVPQCNAQQRRCTALIR